MTIKGDYIDVFHILKAIDSRLNDLGIINKLGLFIETRDDHKTGKQKIIIWRENSNDESTYYKLYDFDI